MTNEERAAQVLAAIERIKAAEREYLRTDRESRVEAFYRARDVVNSAEAAFCQQWENVEALLKEAALDRERLDWLEGEVEREMESRTTGPSLFRRNQPITRLDIDAAMKVPNAS